MTSEYRSREQLVAELESLRIRVRALEAAKAGGLDARGRRAADVAPAALEESSQGVLVFDAHGALTSCNRSACEITGWPVDDAIGSRAGDLLGQEGATDPITSVLSHGVSEHFERFSIQRRTGGTVEVRLSVAPSQEDGRVTGAVATFDGISEAGGAAWIGPVEGAAELLDGISLETAREGSFQEQATRVLDHLVGACGADRAVLLMSEGTALSEEGASGALVIEAPPGSRLPGPEPVALRAPFDESMPRLGDDGVRSLAALPVKSSGQVVGMLSVVSSSPEHFTASRVRLVGYAVDWLGAMAERSVLAYRAAHSRADVDLLHAVTEILRSAGGFDEAASRVLDLVAQGANGMAALGMLHGVDGEVQWIGTPLPEVSENGRARPGSRRTVVGRVTRRGAAVVLDAPAARRDPLVGAWHVDAEAAAAVPVWTHGELIAVMLVTSREAHGFSSDRMQLLGAVAQALGAELANARLERELNAGFEREYERLAAVQEAAARLTIADSPDEALQRLVDGARDLVQSAYGGVAVWNLQGNVTTLIGSGVAAGGGPSDEGGDRRLTAVLGLVRFALVQNRKRIIRVSESSEQTDDGETPLLSSLIGVPFGGKDGSIGTFFLVDKQGAGRFTAEDERLVGLFSAMAAVLLDNIRLYASAERQRRTLTSIQTSMAEGLLVLDADGQVTFCNPAAEELLATSKRQLRGKSLRALVLRTAADYASPEAAVQFAELLEHPRPATFEVSRLRPSRRDLAVSVFQIEASAMERLTGLLVRDVTEERELERRRDTFVSVASHELRTPMTTVMGFTELLLSRDDPERRSAWLRHIYEDSKRVVRIVDDLLNVSRIQSGQLSVELEPIGLPELVKDVVEGLRPTSNAHELVVEVLEGLPAVMADTDKLEQVTLNLLSNAIKYSPKGGRVTVGAWHDGQTDRVVMSVADEGVGIAKEDQEQLFSTFYRIYRSETHGVRGSGLGLYIVKGLVESMGGEVWLESELDQGSTFYVALPVARVPAGRSG